MCLCTGTLIPDTSAASEDGTGSGRHDMALYLVIVAVLAVNLTASIAYIAF